MTGILAVIHHLDQVTTLRNAEIAAEAGFEGVLLIEMDGEDHLLDEPSKAVKAAHPDMIVGTNRLTAGTRAAILTPHLHGLDASWIDNPGLSSVSSDGRPEKIAEALSFAREENPDFLFFGSVAFKTQRPDPDPARAARLAADLGWIATTSGPATGIAPEIDKLRIMREAIPDGKLAVASGVDPENAERIAPLVDWILVATGISRDFHNFDPILSRALREVCGEQVVSRA
jgi:hypothetical protein